MTVLGPCRCPGRSPLPIANMSLRCIALPFPKCVNIEVSRPAVVITHAPCGRLKLLLPAPVRYVPDRRSKDNTWEI